MWDMKYAWSHVIWFTHLSHCTNLRQEHDAVALSTFTKYSLPALRLTTVERCVTILGNKHIQVESSSLASGAMYLFIKS